jgi:hypothetical protein
MLSKKGYGSYCELNKLPISKVIKMREYETFLNEYEIEYQAKLENKTNEHR